MDDETDDWAVRVSRAFANVFKAVADFVKTMGQKFLELLEKLRAWVRPMRAAKAREDWKQAHRNARVLSRHPDLASLDRWLDRMYYDPVAYP